MAVTLYPSTLSGKIFWLNPDNLSPIGTRQAAWVDQMGVAGSIETGSAPIVAVGPDSSRNAVLFDNGYFQYALNLTTAAASGGEIWALVKGTTNGVNGAFRFGTSSANDHYAWSDGFIYDDTASTSRISFSHNGIANTWHVLRIQVTATTKTYWLNGTQAYNGPAVPAQFSTAIHLGGNNGGISQGSLSEVIIFNRSLTDAEATNMQAYLGNGRALMADNFVDAGPLALGSAGTVIPTVVSSFTLEAGEPGSGTNSGWGYIDAPSSGRILVSTVGSACDTLLDVYTGGSLSTLTNVASSDDEGGNGTSQLVFDAVAGTRYYVRAALKTGAPGSYRMYADLDNRWLQQARNDGALLAWVFDSASVSVPVPDLSGNNRTATWTSGVETNIDHNQIFAAFKGAFRGNSSAYLSSVASGFWPSSGSVTIEALVYFDNLTGSTMLFSWSGLQFDFLWGHPSAPGYMGLNNGVISCSGPPVPSVGWHHFAIVVPIGASSTTAKYYLDGALMTAAFGGTAFTIPSLAGAGFRVGHWTGGWEVSSAVRATGVAAYPTELTAAQVAAHARAAVQVFSDRLVDYAVVLPLPISAAATKMPAFDSSSWTIDASEPAANVATKTAWAAFDAIAGSTYQLDTIASSYDTSAAVYTRSAGVLQLVAADNSSGGSNNAKVVWSAPVSQRYYLQVGASPSASPDFGTIYPRLSTLTYGGAMIPTPTLGGTESFPAFLLKGRSTKAFDAQPGG